MSTFFQHEMDFLNILLNDQKTTLKSLVIGPGAQRSFWLSSRSLVGYLLMSCSGQKIDTNYFLFDSNARFLYI